MLRKSLAVVWKIALIAWLAPWGCRPARPSESVSASEPPGEAGVRDDVAASNRSEAVGTESPPTAREATSVAPARSGSAETQASAAARESELAARVSRDVAVVLSQSELPAAAAVVAPSGGVLALGAHRGVDPSAFAGRPGSTVKPLLAWVAAEAGVLSAHHQVTCDGTYDGGFRCPGKHGTLDLSSALEVSCNVYFFDLSARLGLERITRGFTGFGLPPPVFGVQGKNVPLLYGTGHGPIEVTPLALAKAYATLLERLREESARAPASVRAQILAGMRRAVTGNHGTARRAAVEGLELAGKTGTAEGGSYADEGHGAGLPENSWFVGFAPVKEPEVIVALVVVGGAATGAASPLAGRIFERAVER